MPISKSTLQAALFFGIGIFILCGNLEKASGGSANIGLQIIPQFNNAPLVLDSLTNQTPAGQKCSVTRLDFLLSDFSIHTTDGTWLEQSNWQAYVSFSGGRLSSAATNIPVGVYDKIRFRIGLNPELNHSNPAQYPAGHPLNPNLNGLHWNWKGGYVFLALEGNWIDRNGKQNGYSYHIATDRQLMTVELPVELKLSADAQLILAMNVDKVFSAPHTIEFDGVNNTTHSRTNDTLADHLRENIEKAFTVSSVNFTVPTKDELTSKNQNTKSVLIGSNATPYRLTISQFFPQPELPRDNPLTEEGVKLGAQLFFDGRLSVTGRQSCSACHQAHFGMGERRSISFGAEGQRGKRNAMPLVNLAWKSSFFWDGRAATLREQVLQPIQDPLEMHETLTNIVKKISASTNYHNLFLTAFGAHEINADLVARALEQYLLAQVSHNAKFDRVLNGEEKFTAQEQRGFELFHTEYDPRRGEFGADCFHCHGGTLFQSQSFANNGLDFTFKDLGRYNVTKRDSDKGKFAVPSLRNVALTAPYMHDGRFRTLDETIEHYRTGTKRSATLDPNLEKHPDGGVPLSNEDKRALIAFLETLTDAKYEELAERFGAIEEP